MSNGELCLEPVFSGRNPKTGRFVKGHQPANKGKKWDEYMSKRNQRKAARGWKNLDIHRHRSENAGRPKKPVIAVMDDGTWLWLPYVGAAAMWLEERTGKPVRRENICRCCRLNVERKVKTITWHSCGHGIKGVGKEDGSLVNTDHRYLGIRFYFECDSAWPAKIRKT